MRAWIIVAPIATALYATALCATALTAEPTENWDQFRGPGARGVGEGSSLPDKWSKTENVAWVVDVPGRGWSSPVVHGDRVFLTTAISAGQEATPKKSLYFFGDQKEPSRNEHRWVVLCLDFKSGKTLWEREIRKGKPEGRRHIKNNYAPETQCTDGEMVYSYFGDVGLFAHDMKGELKWKHETKAYKTRFGWGNAASPIIYENQLFIVNDNEEVSFVEALDKKTGKVRWHEERTEKSNWSTPFVWKNEKRVELITPGTRRTRSYSLDGKLLWDLRAPMSSITIATPYAAHGLLYISSGYVGDNKKPIYAVRPGASGTVTVEKGKALPKSIAWSSPRAAPYNPTTLVYGDLLYVLKDFGSFACYDAKTGAEVYEEARVRERKRTPFTASPWAYNGKVFCLSEDGDCFVYDAGRERKQLHVNSLGEMCMATPAIARGSLFIRTMSKLYRIAKD